MILKLLKKRAAVAFTLAVLIAACVLLVTDLRARTEVRRTTRALTLTENHLSTAQAQLLSTQAQVKATASEVRTLEASIAQTQSSLATSIAATASTERGIVYGGFDISALDTCLGGVTQALDQVAVGQTAGALSSLGTASTSCNSAKTGAGSG